MTLAAEKELPVEDAELVLTQVASDNVEAGRLAARALGEVNPNAKVGIIHYSVNKACIDRVAGFTEAARTFPAMKILSTQDAKGTSEATRPVMRQMLVEAGPRMDPRTRERLGKVRRATLWRVYGSRSIVLPR